MKRRSFLFRTGVALGTGAMIPQVLGNIPSSPPNYDSWASIRSQFNLKPGINHMSQMLLASHPTPVREAIEKHRKAFDENPAEYWESNMNTAEQVVKEAAAKYLEAKPEEIALTDSTTMGLGTLYTGLKLDEGDDVLTSTHGHYVTHMSLKYASQKNGASVRTIPLYDDPSKITLDEVLSKLKKAIQPNTKVLALTWVHSSTGVKMPINEIGKLVAQINAKRTENDQIIYCVDGVHGFGVEDITMAEIGCDFFIAGTHKWLFGPRGTGIVWGRQDAWNKVIPTIPAFSETPFITWMGIVPEGTPVNFDQAFTPGGFHAFDHRWALNEAFDFHMSIGKAKIQERTHELGRMMRDGLKNIKHVKLHTPNSSEFASGINSFEVEGMEPKKIVEALHKKHIISSTSPYKISYARLTPAITNTAEEVNQCIKAMEEIRA